MIDPTVLRGRMQAQRSLLPGAVCIDVSVAELESLLDENAALREKVKEADDATLEVIRERDELENRLDQFAYRIAPAEVIGEHSSGNDPWLNALRMCVSAKDADDLLTRAERAESRLAALTAAGNAVIAGFGDDPYAVIARDRPAVVALSKLLRSDP